METTSTGTGASAAGTGVEEVDAVLRTLEDLDVLPLAAHVGVFEAAQAALRAALDAGGAAPATVPTEQKDGA